VGAGIFAVPAALSASVGAYAPIAFLMCALAMGSIGICFAEGGSRVPTSGGAYGYIDEAFGPFVAYVAGTLLWVSNVLACGGLAAAVADIVTTLAPSSLAAPVHALVIVGVVTAIAAVNLSGVSRGARLVSAATLVKLIPLVLFVVAGASAIDRTRLLASGNVDPSGLGRAVSLALFALSGMEGAVSASGEVANPARAIPRAIGAALSLVTVLYISVQIVAQGILGDALARSSAPLVDAMTQVHPSLRAVMLAGAVLSMLGFVSSDLLSTPRILFAFGRDGLMPRALGRLHPRTHTPHVAIVCYASIAMLLALTGTFAQLAVLSMLAIAPLYMAACAAAWRLARRGVAMAGPPFGFRWLGVSATAGVASMVVLIALASRSEMAGLGAVLGLSTLGYVVRPSRGVPATTAPSALAGAVAEESEPV
jgi:amino acid transporter